MSLAQDLLLLQGHIKRDSPGYQDEFELQWRHFNACLELLRLSPDQPSAELGELATFMSHVASCYPALTSGFSKQLISTLEEHHAAMEAGLRLTLIKALIMLRNKNQLPATELVPLLFRMFRLRDKPLRQLVFRHVTSDIRAANRHGRDEKLNRAVQRFMYSAVADAHEGTAKRALAVLTEMWRRRVWRDARTVNVIASAVRHPSPSILLAALKFFVGQDAQEKSGSDSEDDEGDKNGGGAGPQGPSREDIYSAFHKGTIATKKRKQKKLKRVRAAVARVERRRDGVQAESFAALQLLHDPQGFAEALLERLRSASARWETRLLVMSVLSRVIGVHKLILLNFYPLVQRYMTPKTEQVTAVLAAFVQACHDQVPPDALAPALRTLVDQFVHDRARPEVMTVGLKTVRELCTRTPLVMTQDLLQDLVAYKKNRERAVSSAARSLISLFRELAPALLEKKDRGRGADLTAAPREYGASTIASGIAGLDLLLQAEREGKIDSDGELVSSDEEESEEEGDDIDAEEDGSEEEGEEEEGSEEEVEEEEEGDGSEEEEEQLERSASEQEENGIELSSEVDSDSEAESGEELESDDDELGADSDVDIRVLAKEQAAPKKKQTAPQAGSLNQLRKKLNETKAAKEEADTFVDRILGPEDFEKIRRLQHKRLVESAMEKQGLMSASKRARAQANAEEAAEESMALRERLGLMHEGRVAPDELLGRHKHRRDKAERMAAVMEGREGREFAAKSSLKKKKTGGLSNREKAKRKALPLAARSGQARSRLQRNKLKNSKNFKGHVRK